MARSERHVTVGARGRVVLPAVVRAQLGLEPGTRMLLSTEPDGSVRLRPYRAIADGNRGLLADLADSGVSLADELAQERRREAAREDEA